uniref:Ig-like domain-containing protein n=1 Tax=Pseudonaja textilis TaxID=8673 RepID=A0A670Z073_PSETE
RIPQPTMLVGDFWELKSKQCKAAKWERIIGLFYQRLGFLFRMPFHNVSLVINNTKEMDSGQYMCTVNVPDDSTVKGRNIGLVNLTVLVPPSPPKCQFRGSAQVGGNITMSCKSAFGKPVPVYRWQRTEPSTQFFFAPTQDTKKGMLTLTNLTIDMSGLYLCNASSIAGYSNCTLNLEVHPRESLLDSSRSPSTLLPFAWELLGAREGRNK